MTTPRQAVKPAEIEFGKTEKGSTSRLSARIIVEDRDDNPTKEKLICHTHNRWIVWPTGAYGEMVWTDEIEGKKLPARSPASGNRIAFIRSSQPDGPPIDRWCFADEYDYCLVYVTSEVYRVVNTETGEIVWSARYSDQEGALIRESGKILFGKQYAFEILRKVGTKRSCAIRPKDQLEPRRKLQRARRVPTPTLLIKKS